MEANYILWTNESEKKKEERRNVNNLQITPPHISWPSIYPSPQPSPPSNPYPPPTYSIPLTLHPPSTNINWRLPQKHKASLVLIMSTGNFSQERKTARSVCYIHTLARARVDSTAFAPALRTEMCVNSMNGYLCLFIIVCIHVWQRNVYCFHTYIYGKEMFIVCPRKCFPTSERLMAK